MPSHFVSSIALTPVFAYRVFDWHLRIGCRQVAATVDRMDAHVVDIMPPNVVCQRRILQ